MINLWEMNICGQPDSLSFALLPSVSQFTLYALLKKNKLDFHQAMKSDQSKEFYHTFLKSLKTDYQDDKVKDGVFGAYMDVSISNDGPVTIELDSRKSTYSQGEPAGDS